MTGAKHTPGPWETLAQNGCTIIAPTTGPFQIIAECENSSDAKLIAAAPDMAEALRSAANLLDQSPAIGARVSEASAELALSIIRAALAKAGL